MPVKGPKVKISRSLNLAITPKAARIMETRPYGPGQHGQARKRNPSVYKTQLLEKQRLKETYNVSEAQLRKAYAKAAHIKGSTGDALLQILETRLDATVLRMGLAKTIYAARQYVAHGHFLLNGQRSFTPSTQLREGDTIAVREKSKTHTQIVEALANAPELPAYLEVNKVKMEGRLISKPERDQIPVQLTEQLVVEYYSR